MLERRVQVPTTAYSEVEMKIGHGTFSTRKWAAAVSASSKATGSTDAPTSAPSKMVMLSRFVALSVSLTLKASPAVVLSTHADKEDQLGSTGAT